MLRMRTLNQIRLAMACSLVWSMVTVGSLSAQPPADAPADAPAAAPYKTIPLPEQFEIRSTISKVKLAKDRVLIGRTLLDDNRDEFLSWYRDYQFRRLTLPAHFHELDRIRAELLVDIRKARSPDARQFLLSTYFDYASKLATGNYYPQARVNSTLLISDLNSQEENIGRRTLPVPYAPALAFMMQQLQNESQLDAVKAVCLVGIRRHVKLALTNSQSSLTGAQRNAIVSTMTTLIKQSDPPAGRSVAGHTWMQRRAMESATVLVNLSDDDSLLKELTGILERDPIVPSLACSAARALGNLNYPQGVAVDPLPIAQRMGTLVVRAVDREVDRVAKEKSEASNRDASSGFDGLGGDPGDQGSNDDDGYEEEFGDQDDPYSSGSGGDESGGDGASEMTDEVNRTRRVLKYQFVCLLEGLYGPEFRRRNKIPSGIIVLAADDQAKQKQITDITDAIAAVLLATDPAANGNAFKDEDELLAAVQKKLAALEALLPQPEPAEGEKPAEPAGEPGEPAGEPGKPAGEPSEPASEPGEPAGEPDDVPGAGEKKQPPPNGKKQ